MGERSAGLAGSEGRHLVDQLRSVKAFSAHELTRALVLEKEELLQSRDKEGAICRFSGKG